MNRALWIIMIASALVLGLAVAGCSLNFTSAPASQPSTAQSEKSAPPSTTPSLTTGTSVGYLAPDFKLQSLDGQTFSLSSLRGKPVLLNFWATWCPPCVLEMPILEEVYQQWSGKGLVLAAIDIQESPSKVKEFMQKQGLSLPVLLDSKGVVAAQYNIAALPTTYFIDKDGIIREKKIGAFSDRADVERGLSKIIP